jgi:chromosome segregation ATPase
MSAGGDRVSRRELVETIDKQNEQLSRYETRLRDVVRAYKGLAKEKEALEKSLSAISGQKDDADSKTNHSEENSLSEKPKSGNGEQSDCESIASSNGEGQPDVRSLKSQVRTLTASLSTLSIEKSTLEGQFQQAKKKSVQEKAEIEKKVESLSAELQSVKTNAKKELDETKSKWIVERHNREKESNDHALMLRELQKLVADERSAKEKFEFELSKAKDNLKALELAGTFNAEYEKRVRELVSCHIVLSLFEIYYFLSLFEIYWIMCVHVT